jgi:hypothetical protein
MKEGFAAEWMVTSFGIAIMLGMLALVGLLIWIEWPGSLIGVGFALVCLALGYEVVRKKGKWYE